MLKCMGADCGPNDSKHVLMKYCTSRAKVCLSNWQGTNAFFTQYGTYQSSVGLTGIVHSVMGSMRSFYCFRVANSTPNTLSLESEGGIIQTEA